MPVLGDSGAESGLIIKWSGTLAAIPSGWLLCDGTNSTPDMRSRFSRQVPNATSDAGTAGGADTVVLTTSTIPAHGHTVVGDTHVHLWGTSGNSQGNDGNSSSVTTSSNNLGSITVGSTGADEAHENRPSYFELLFIMKD